MNKGLVLILVGLMSGVSPLAMAQTNNISVEEEAQNNSSPTVIFGEAANSEGGENEAEVLQNQKDGNPLGAPVVDMNSRPIDEKTIPAGVQPTARAKTLVPQGQIAPIYQSTDQGVEKPWQEPLPQLSNKIENELYQSGNDIIDVQAYPIDDVSTVTTPNIQPTIITQ